MSVQFSSLQATTARYAHICLSPHLDDAALSMGGVLAAVAARGEPALVVNICSGSPPPGGPFSAFAALQHQRWGLPADQAVARRRAEDAAALAILGVDSLDLGLLDAIYRMPMAYVDDQTLFGAVAADDTLAADLLPPFTGIVERFPEATFYVPLGVGCHVDHQAVYALIQTLVASRRLRLAYYEDFPYVAKAGALERRKAELGSFAAESVTIDATIERKIAAIGAYTSQLATLFDGAEAMAQAVDAYGRRVAPAGGVYGERLWLPR